MTNINFGYPLKKHGKNGVKGAGPLAGGSEGGRSRPLFFLLPFLLNVIRFFPDYVTIS